MKGMNLKRSLIGMGLTLAAGLSWGTATAQEEPATLETVTVTAERFPVREKDSSRFVSVYTADELEETGADNLVDALRRKGTFAYKAYGPLGMSRGSMTSSLSIRGIENGELVLINGSPVQGAGGHTYDLSAIPVEQIERVEVLKGAASTLYGADAMSGVINIITKRNPAETSTRAGVEVGNYQYGNAHVGFQSSIVNVGFNYQHLGGITGISRDFTSKYRYDFDATHKYNLNLDITPFENLHIDYLGSYYKTGYKKIYDSGKPMEGTDQEDDYQFADIRYDGESLKVKAFVSYSRIDTDEYTNPAKPDVRNVDANYGVEGDFRREILSTAVTVGGDYSRRSADYKTSFGKHHRDDYAIFAQLKREFLDRLMLSAGAREQFIHADADGENYNIFLPTFGGSYKATEDLNLFANVGKAFRAPTFANLYYQSSFISGNPDLKPEKGWTYEGGIKLDTPFTQIRLACFYMDYSDKIELDRSKGYPLTYFNAGDYTSWGVEWQMDLFPFVHRPDFLQDISFNTAGYWADPTANDPNGKAYQTGPKFKTSLGASYLSENLVLQLIADLLMGRENHLDNNFTLDFYGKYKVWKGYITAGVSNIFNSEVQVTGDLSAGSFNNYLYYGMDRMFKVGYEVRF
jgi:outer membrane receptor protein involved in Fe transport